MDHLVCRGVRFFPIISIERAYGADGHAIELCLQADACVWSILPSH